MDLIPPIAAGDLSRHSVAELVAAAFRANATGTLAIEQGTGESRLFMRYGQPCGALLYRGFKSFGRFLEERGVVDAATVAATREAAQASGRRHGDQLVAQGLVDARQLQELLAAQHAENVVTLCALRDGRYELRGWERPPEWTEGVQLDPLRLVTDALLQAQLADRRAAILEYLSHEKLRKVADFDDLAGRLTFGPLERRALVALAVPRAAEEIGLGLLERDEADAFVCALVLLGLLEPDDGRPVASLAAPAVEQDFSPLLQPVADDPPAPVAPPPAYYPSYAPPPAYPAYPAYPAADALFSPLDDPFAAVASQPGAPQGHPLHAPLGDPPTYAPSEALAGNPNESQFVPIAEDLGSGFTPPPAPRAVADRTGEFEFESAADEVPLELDLERAPRKLVRDRLEDQLQQTAPRPRPTTRAQMPVVRAGTGTTSSTAQTRPGSAPPPARPVRPPEGTSETSSRARRTRTANEYNPFSFQLTAAKRPETPPAPIPAAPPPPPPLSAAGLDLLDQRLEAALADAPDPGRRVVDDPFAPDEPTPDPLDADAVVEEGTDEDLEPPPPGSTMLMRPMAPRGREAPAVDILEGIADAVGDLGDEAPAPLDLPEERKSADSGDELALQAAREAAEVAEPELRDEAALTEDELALGLDTVEPLEETTGNTVSSPDGPAPGDLEKQQVRRRLLQRAFQSVGGNVFQRDDATKVPTAAPAPKTAPRVEENTARPEKVDLELERDVVDKLNRMGTEDHFVRLDVPRTAGTDQVKEAFLALAKRYHPDRLSASGQTHLLPQVRELFSKVKESYDVLVDPVTRARHLTALEAKSSDKPQKSPEEGKAAFQRAMMFARRHDLRNAEAELVRAVGADEQPEYLAELAWTLLSNPARRDEAKAEIRDLVARALKATPEHDRAFVVAAYVARADGDTDKAEKLFRRALERNPKNVDAARELRLIEQRRPAERKGTGLLDKLRRK